MSLGQLKVMSAIERCEECAHLRISYNSCRNRSSVACVSTASSNAYQTPSTTTHRCRLSCRALLHPSLQSSPSPSSRSRPARPLRHPNSPQTSLRQHRSPPHCIDQRTRIGRMKLDTSTSCVVTQAELGRCDPRGSAVLGLWKRMIRSWALASAGVALSLVVTVTAAAQTPNYTF